MRNVFQEARIVLPLPDPHLPPPQIREHLRLLTLVEDRIVEAFGGFTATVGSGARKDGAGRIVRDDVQVYDIACPAFAPAAGSVGAGHESERAWLGAATTLREIAKEACGTFSQACVYVRFPSGEVLFVGPGGRSVNADADGPGFVHAADFWHRRASERV